MQMFRGLDGEGMTEVGYACLGASIALAIVIVWAVIGRASLNKQHVPRIPDYNHPSDVHTTEDFGNVV